MGDNNNHNNKKVYYERTLPYIPYFLYPFWPFIYRNYLSNIYIPHVSKKSLKVSKVNLNH